jgi:hypothetical protein
VRSPLRGRAIVYAQLERIDEAIAVTQSNLPAIVVLVPLERMRK